MRIDVLLDDNLDLLDDGNGDWAEGESSQSDAELITLAGKGENRMFPFAGFWVRMRLKAKINQQQFISNLTDELENDGFTNPQINIGSSLSDFTITLNE